MKALSFLEGRWEGEGWMREGPGEPRKFRGLETVDSRLGGRVLVIEGLHRDTVSDQVAHHAFATIVHDPEGEGYRLRAHLADGRSGDYRGQLSDGQFVWEYRTGPVRIRYTIRIEGDTWNEVGYFSTDGENWNQMLEMNLRRTGDGARQ